MLWKDLVKATCLVKIAVKLGMGEKIVTDLEKIIKIKDFARL